MRVMILKRMVSGPGQNIETWEIFFELASKRDPERLSNTEQLLTIVTRTWQLPWSSNAFTCLRKLVGNNKSLEFSGVC